VQRQTGGPGGNTSYYALDTAMFDGYGAKLGDTDAFTGGAEPTRDAMGFQGQFGAYTDNETGLVLMGHRYYDAGTGRFLTRDPLGYNGGINLYGFTGNNPVNEIDPEGTAVVEVRYREVMAFDSKHLYWKTGGYHAFIVVTDTDGAQYEIAGGPVGSPFGDYPIYVRHSEYKYRDKHGHKAYDFPVPGDHVDRPKSTVLIRDNKSAWYYMNRFIAVGDQINKADIQYMTLFSNSNSTVRELIQRSNTGLKPPTKRPVWTPGWDTQLPIKSGHALFNGRYGPLE
jgi:RHS repeat-associated protein